MADFIWRPSSDKASTAQTFHDDEKIRSLEDLADALLTHLEGVDLDLNSNGDENTNSPEHQGQEATVVKVEASPARTPLVKERTPSVKGRSMAEDVAEGSTADTLLHVEERPPTQLSYDVLGRTPLESSSTNLPSNQPHKGLRHSESISSFHQPNEDLPRTQPNSIKSFRPSSTRQTSSMSLPFHALQEPHLSNSSLDLHISADAQSSPHLPPRPSFISNSDVEEHLPFNPNLLIRPTNSQFVDVASLSGRSSPRESIGDLNAVRIWNQHHPSIIFEEPLPSIHASFRPQSPAYGPSPSYWKRLLKVPQRHEEPSPSIHASVRAQSPNSGLTPSSYWNRLLRAPFKNRTTSRGDDPTTNPNADWGQPYQRGASAINQPLPAAWRHFEPESQTFLQNQGTISGAISRWKACWSNESESSQFEVIYVIMIFVLITVPEQIYLYFLLRLPSLYLSRVAKIFEEAAMSVDELRSMVIEKALQEKTLYAIHIALEKSPTTPAYASLKHTWEMFIDSVMREWKTFNIISVLLLTAILTILQIDTAAQDPIIRYAALLSLICALISLLFGCMYIVRFGTMRKTYKATEWAMEAAHKQFVWWNVWILLAMPAVWLTWSIILYIVCIMAFVWRTNLSPGETIAELPLNAIKALRIIITIVLGLGVLFGCLIVSTFRRYGDQMDRSWQNRIEHLRREKELDDAMRRFMSTYHRTTRNGKANGPNPQQVPPRRSRWTKRTTSLGGVPWYAAKNKTPQAIDTKRLA